MMEVPNNPLSGSLAWTCPSNIALIKYWGKRDLQLPMNPSLSMTLREARTTTRIRFSFDPALPGGKLRFRFEGKKRPEFEKRIRTYLEGLDSLIPVLKYCSLEIDSENTFPHSSGIASSASSMGALALCLVELEAQIRREEPDPDSFLNKASRLARLGSGSASRSLFPDYSLWGKTELWKGSSDEYAIPVQNYHETFRNLRDRILIVESGQKRISSSVGHSLMKDHPFAIKRFDQARDNLKLLQRAFIEGNWKSFISVVEEEALSLHAMMLTSKPGFILMQPGTLSIMHKIREYREQTGQRLCFTLDAGANVHLLHAEADEGPVEDFVKSELIPFCENGRFISDKMGPGPVKAEGT